jgi:hypothetical protein
MDAEVFQGAHELDRALRTADKSRKQMEWFTKELQRMNLVSWLTHPQHTNTPSLWLNVANLDTQDYEQRIEICVRAVFGIKCWIDQYQTISSNEPASYGQDFEEAR